MSLVIWMFAFLVYYNRHDEFRRLSMTRDVINPTLKGTVLSFIPEIDLRYQIKSTTPMRFALHSSLLVKNLNNYYFQWNKPKFNQI